MTVAATKKKSSSINIVTIILAILFSGACWYVSDAFTGDYWYLMWIAPVPVILLSLRLSARAAFIISFLAYLIGRLSWFSYLVSVATIVPAIIFTILIPLVFAVIMIGTRRIVTRYNKWWVVFAFPVLYTTFDFLVFRFSADGSAASIAYTQSDLLPIIQLASITGIAGISFIITLVPSVIASSLFFRKGKKKVTPLLVTSIIIIAAVLLYGEIRINSKKEGPTIKVGLAVIDEKYHYITNHPDTKNEIQSAEYYADAINKLSGVRLIVLPERAINITKETDSAVMNILTTAAKENHVIIITGYTNFRKAPSRNSALVINADGNLLADYNKVHLVTGLESQFTPGNDAGFFQFDNTAAGVAICKDLDFPAYIRKYGGQSINLLCIPAWDFTKDDWLHSRMAILRGVENGFSEVRTARLGRLTISDYTGKVNFEAGSAQGNAAALTGEVSLQRKDTLYSRFGDWFGILNVIIALVFIFLAIKKRPLVM